MSYPGGKGGAGVYQKIINIMPPHKTYIEGFLGSGIILKTKKPAQKNIGLDLSDTVVNQDWDAQIFQVNTIEWLSKYQWQGNELVYLDPPYVLSTRTNKKIYEHEMTDKDHLDLLRVIKKIPAKIIISGYWSELYATELGNWNNFQFQAMTRGGQRTETVWYNYDKPTRLHDYSFLGENFTERQRITRKKKRWIERLSKMDDHEKYALLDVIDTAFGNQI
ncbi:DNA adenine methylase [Kiloniella laminariae]|uniref:site-specific DNA-methyltransferase (adenine-specific) n=1 Tax=Kiloniella laminariae TaxID=454162 RepID=A0ABT4LPR8_9PROT|nr:DNA adenine methylase [Kiloniella laminariae]MCZ4283132.1 DNA adenine methylase [Kiloniella laminariae]